MSNAKVLTAVPAFELDPPTISMTFGVKDSPLGGRDGTHTGSIGSLVSSDRVGHPYLQPHHLRPVPCQNLLVHMLDNHCIKCNKKIEAGESEGEFEGQTFSSFYFLYLPLDFNLLRG
ncbi:uncharacterized protein LOC124702873 [Lolium rigidum]|uniref:uncharacterized protein LOC124702873 n=1 Tax=Lolium rigidum TaxID=89674 RepID=UPI001F5D8938|nr:uncharacterized protein LOC124702873 [Lolium rigidum]XP_047091005.1 uncharacterized protein LOC124702873 [Lolium rigidum]XP_047091006.1 uncharacterized protein LOC124702873 [Lolium rigidum]